MALAPGSRVGTYEITSKLGEGGMGAVYRARDTRLGRDVAIKVISDAVGSDPDRLARFEREARTLAALNHPNIAQLYGVEGNALVMELVEGEDLSEIIARHGHSAPAARPERGAERAEAERMGVGPHSQLSKAGLPFPDALAIARQLIDALEAAHDVGIVHRDLKPANIKVREDGTVKVLDFGLAKAMDPNASGAAEATPYVAANSPTLTARATQLGMILGTAAYMSPEQARGRAVDKRTDVWAFGCVLYEMLTGVKAFDGDDATEIISSVVKSDPNLAALPATLPANLRAIVTRCLIKDRKTRIPDMSVVRYMLDGSMAVEASPAASPSRGTTPRFSILLAAIGGIVLGVLATAAVLSYIRTGTTTAPVVRTSIPLPQGAPIWLEYFPGSAIAISPDGDRIVYATAPPGDRLRERRLDDSTVRTIAGTAGAQQPFFSTDGAWLGFFSSDGYLKKMPIQGGTPAILARNLPAAGFSRACWADDGRIVFDTWLNGLRVIGPDGENPQTLTDASTGQEMDPAVLPGSKLVLFTVLTGGHPRIDMIGLDGSGRATVLDNASGPKFVDSGHLLFMRDGALMAVPFDARAGRLSGSIVPVPMDVALDLENQSAPSPQLAVSRTGVLVYGKLDQGGGQESTLTWVDFQGNATGTIKLPMRSPYLDLSPDDTKLALSSRRGDASHIQVFDLERGSTVFETDITLDYPSTPMWTTDNAIVLARANGAEGQLWLQPLDGSAGRLIWKAPTRYWGAGGASLDGRLLSLLASDLNRPISDVFVLDPLNPGSPRNISGTPNASEFTPSISPDGQWIAYGSDENGVGEIFIRRTADGSEKTKLPKTRVNDPKWSPDGRQLLFTANDVPGMTSIFAIDIDTSPRLRVGATARKVFDNLLDGFDIGRTWAVAHKSERILTQRGSSLMARSSELVVVQQWFEELKRLAPAR